MTIEDWRDADAVTVQQLFAAEAGRWASVLGWDTQASWAVIEEGRRRGHVPGWILRARTGEARGWTYYLLHDGELQIGGMTAHRATDFRLLLDHVLDSPEASLASSVSGFVFPAPASLVSALSRRRFVVRRSLYLSKPLDAPPNDQAWPAGRRLRPFDTRDVFPAARLLAAAYEGVPGADCFAPHGRLEEWARYLRQLLDTPACGRWMPDASYVVDMPGRSSPDALVLTTRLSDTTAHIAQLVVGRDLRGQGVGAWLLQHASATALSGGHSCMTLMVDEGNDAALRLYARQGFGLRSVFASARRRGQVRPPVLAAAAVRRVG